MILDTTLLEVLVLVHDLDTTLLEVLHVVDGRLQRNYFSSSRLGSTDVKMLTFVQVSARHMWVFTSGQVGRYSPRMWFQRIKIKQWKFCRITMIQTYRVFSCCLMWSPMHCVRTPAPS